MNEDCLLAPTIFILGAGFTKAFNEDAPLLELDIDIEEIKSHFKTRNTILRILEDSLVKDTIGNVTNIVNVESLLTRLWGLPYDRSLYFSEEERKLLYDRVLYNFYKKIVPLEPKTDVNTLMKLCLYILNNKSSVITFNNDIVLDKSLLTASFKIANVTALPNLGLLLNNSFVWNPETGYGFRLNPSMTLLNDYVVSYYPTTSLLLKLHGSANWFVKRGSTEPFTTDKFVFVENSFIDLDPKSLGEIYLNTEKYPLIIPPILDKSLINRYPILNIIWEKAYKNLKNAKSIVFIGYSIPITDLSARFLFKEGLRDVDPGNIHIVTRAKSNKQEEDNFKAIYEEALNKKLKNFYFEGTVKWINQNIK